MRGFAPSGDFLHRRLAPGVDAFLRPTRRFKTLLVRAYLLQPLTERGASALSLAAAILKQGSRDLPDPRALHGALDRLYGADLDLDTARLGEIHLLEADLTLPSGRYTGDPKALEDGLGILAGVLGRPLKEGTGFPPGRLRRERANLLDALAAAKNHKPGWATLRCIQTACAREPYRFGRYGTPQALRRLQPDGLWRFWQDAAARAPLAVYAVGAFDAEEMADRLARAFLPLRRGPARPLPSSGFRRGSPRCPATRTEREEVRQARLCLAFRTGTAWGDPGFTALVLAASVLGGGSHAKLFQEVREKTSLAYDATASLEKSKGLMLLSAGVDPAQRDRAEAIILEQVEDVRAGRISGREWADSRASLLNQVRMTGDHPGRLVAMHLEGWVNGHPRAGCEVQRRIRAATPEEASEAARRWTLSATYCLTAGKGR